MRNGDQGDLFSHYLFQRMLTFSGLMVLLVAIQVIPAPALFSTHLRRMEVPSYGRATLLFLIGAPTMWRNILERF